MIAEAPTSQEPQVLTMPDLAPRDAVITVRGTAPLICHAWSKKAKEMMLAKQQKRASAGKEAKDPERDFRESLYELSDGGYGFPAIAFKAACVRAGTFTDLKMTFLRGVLRIPGEMVKIEGSEPTMREDMVRVGNGVADIRYRGQFIEWWADVPIRYNARAISLEQVVNLFRVAGFSVGVGEWRPEKDGEFGTFEVEKVQEAKEAE